jgi:DNA replication protein DnaC
MKKAQCCIIDEIGYTPITRAQANRFFNFISDTYEWTSIIFTTNKENPNMDKIKTFHALSAPSRDESHERF